MADPITAGLAIAGGATGALGSIFGGEAAAASYKYQAAIQEMNAGIANQQAGMDAALGDLKGVQIGLQGAQQRGAARAAAGAGGLDVNSGSPAAVQNSILQSTRINEGNSEFGYLTRGWGARISATEDIAQSQADLLAASNATTAGTIGAFSSVLGAGLKISGQSVTGQTVGMQALNLNPGGGSGLGNLGFLNGLS